MPSKQILIYIFEAQCAFFVYLLSHSGLLEDSCLSFQAAGLPVPTLGTEF